MNDASDARLGMVTAKTLIYAVAKIQELPDRWQEYSDVMDMCEQLQRMDN